MTIFNAEQTIVGLQRTCHSDPLLGKNNQVAKSIDISLHEPLFQPQSTITCVEGTVQEQQHTNNKKGTTSLLQQKTIKKMIQKWGGGGNGEFPDKKRLVFYKNKELHMGDSIRIQGFAVVCYSIYTTFQNDNE